MAKKAAKRFYDTVSVASQEGGYCVKLDTRVLRTPGKKPLVLPSAYLAKLVADEWDAQATHIVPETMPCTRLLNVAMERTPITRDGLAAEVRKYAGTDLLCYREDELRILTQRQTERWEPILNWARDTHEITLKHTCGIVAITQDPISLDRVEQFAARQDDIELTLLAHFTAVFGSAILAIAVIDRHLTADEALSLSRLDELYQIELWGQDEEAQERTDNIYAESIALAKLLGVPK